MLAGLQPDASGGGARSLSACFCDFCGTGVFQCGVFPCFPRIAFKCVCVCVCVCSHIGSSSIIRAWLRMPVALTGWQPHSEKGSAPPHFSKGGKGGEFRSAVGLNHRIGTPTFDASDRFSSWSDASTFTTERSARGQGRRNPDREDLCFF